jgi:predicted Zn-dependent protease
LSDDTLTVRARTIRLDVGRMSEEIVESGPIEDLFAIYARVTRRIVPGRAETLEEMEQDHPPPAAFEQYVKGLLAAVPATRISYLTHARRLAPAFLRPALELWRVYHEQGEHAAALATLRGVPEDHRLHRRAQFLSAVSLMHLERYDEAFDTLTALNRAAPDPAVFNNLGVVQLRRGADAAGARAISYFGDALRLDGTDSDLMFNLGYAYFLDRELSQATSWLREALRRHTADGEAHYVLGAALQMSGSVVEGGREKDLARRLSSELAEFDAASTPGAGEVPTGLERVKTDIDIPATLRVEAAIIEAGQRDQRQLAALHLANGRRFYETSRDSDAIAELRRVVYLSPYQSEAHLLLGRIYLRGGRTGDAIDALKVSIWSEDSVAAHLALAEAHVAAKDPSAARTELQLVLSRDPRNADALRLLDALR